MLKYNQKQRIFKISEPKLKGNFQGKLKVEKYFALEMRAIDRYFNSSEEFIADSFLGKNERAVDTSSDLHRAQPPVPTRRNMSTSQ